jgi:hypothetical protein
MKKHRKSEVPTKADIAASLRKLSEKAQETAVQMDFYGGMAPWARHSGELLGAAGILREWANEIERGET